MSVKLLTIHHLEFLSFKGGCTGSSESTLVKMPHCWKSHAAYHIWTSTWCDLVNCRIFTKASFIASWGLNHSFTGAQRRLWWFCTKGRLPSAFIARQCNELKTYELARLRYLHSHILLSYMCILYKSLMHIYKMVKSISLHYPFLFWFII